MKTHKRGLLVSSSNVALRTGAAIMTLWIASLASEAIAQNTVVAGNQDDGTGFPTICAGADDNVLVGRVVKIGCNTDNGVAIGLSSDIGDDSTGAIAIGQSSSVLDNSQQAIAIGTAAQTNGDGSVAIGVQSFVGTLSTAARSGVAIGVQASVSADFGIALGVQSSVGSSANNSVTIGSQSTATGSRSVVLGSNSSDGGRSDVVAVGNIGGRRKIINMQDGLIANGSSEAVNGSQLFSTNSAIAATLGGGAVINTTTGAITGPVFNVAGGSFTNVGAALAALDNINVNAVVYDNVAKTAATLGAVGGSTPVALRNLAAGVLTVNSREAVNGSQLFATNTAVASAMGAGSGVNGTTGAITGPTFTVVSGTFNNVGAALDAMDTEIGKTIIYDNVGKTAATLGGVGATTAVSLRNLAAGALAANSSDAVNGSQLFATNQNVTTNSTQIAATIASLGAGAAINGTSGAVTAPSFNVVGSTFNNVGSALGAIDTQVAKTIIYDDPGHTAATLGGVGASTAVALRNVASGTIGVNSSDAVNGSQLFATNRKVTDNTNNIAATLAGLGGGASVNNTTGAFTAPVFNILSSSFNNVGEALAALDNELSGAVFYDDAARSRATLGGAGVTAPVSLQNVGAGVVDATSTEAINGSQLFTTNENLDALGVRVGDAETGLSNLDKGIANATIGIVQQEGGTSAGGVIRIGAASGGARLSLIGIDGVRVLEGLGDGRLASDSDEAVNGAQLFATNQLIAGNTQEIGDVQIAVGDNLNTINNLTTSIQNGTIGLVQQDPSTLSIGVGSTVGGNLLSIAGTDGNRLLSGLSAATLDANSSDAVNGSQLFATNEIVDATTQAVDDIQNTLGGNVTNVTNLTTAIQNGTIGLVQQDQTTLNIGVGASVGGSLISFAGTDGNRLLTGLAAAALDATSSDAVNGSQLFATNEIVDANTQAIDDIQTTLGGNVTNVTNLTTAIQNGTIGLVQQDPASRILSVGGNTDGLIVNFAGASGDRRLSGVAAGAVNENSTDAVNGSQLFATDQTANNALRAANAATSGVAGAALALGGGAQFDEAKGAFTAPTYAVAGGSFNDVGSALLALDDSISEVSIAASNSVQYDNPERTAVTLGGQGATSPVTLRNVQAGALSASSKEAVNGSQLFATNQAVTANTTAINNLDGRVTTLEGSVIGSNQAVTNLTTAIQNGTIGLVQQDPATQDINVGAATGGAGVNIAGTSGARTLRGVRAGAVSASSTEAVNGSQLHALQQSVDSGLARVDNRLSGLDSRVGTIELDLRELRGEMNSAVASAIAIGMLPSSTNPGRFTFGMGTGVRSGQMATAFGLSYRTTDDMFTMQARAAFDKEAVSVGVGMGLEF